MLLNNLPNSARPPPYPYEVTAKASIRDVLAENVLALMEERGWKQTRVAKEGGLAQRTVSNVLNKTNDPGTEIIEALGRAFGVPGWTLLIPKVPGKILNSQELPNLVSTYLDAASKPLSTVIAERGLPKRPA
jgi:transcriptional regulator with XRE-family HTH domain